MDIKTVPVEVNGTKFVTTQFAAMRSLTLLARLVKVAGPAMQSLRGVSLDTDLADAVPQIAAALADVDPEVLPDLLADILAGTSVIESTPKGPKRRDLDRAAIDRVFSGRLRDLVLVVAHAIKVNYAGFGTGGPSTSPATTDNDQDE